MAAQGTSTKALAVLLCGTLSYPVLPVVLGVVAWILGNDALRDIDNGTLPETDRSMVKIGRTLGIVNVFLFTFLAACLVASVLVPVFAAVAGAR